MGRLFESFAALVESLEFSPFAPMRRGAEPTITIEELDHVKSTMGEVYAAEVYEDYMRQWNAWRSSNPIRAGMVLRLSDGTCFLVGHYNERSAMLGDDEDGLEGQIESVAYLY